MSSDEMREALGARHIFHGATFSSHAALIVNGFAFQSAQGIVLRGVYRENGEVEVGCLHVPASVSIPSASLVSLDALLSRHNLVYVDWVRVACTSTIGDVLLG
ncbi:MAG: hypothetical protein JST22_16435 [Bacteroidetes bacterium]|nr:hypothetical protein [Bacteroidota bacterium]